MGTLCRVDGAKYYPEQKGGAALEGTLVCSPKSLFFFPTHEIGAFWLQLGFLLKPLVNKFGKKEISGTATLPQELDGAIAGEEGSLKKLAGKYPDAFAVDRTAAQNLSMIMMKGLYFESGGKRYMVDMSSGDRNKVKQFLAL